MNPTIYPTDNEVRKNRILFISILINIVLSLVLLFNALLDDDAGMQMVHGTFVYGGHDGARNEPGAPGVYIAISSTDNVYTLYRQHELIEHGTITQIDRNVFTLISDDGTNEAHVFRDYDNLYVLFYGCGVPLKFERLVDTLLYIFVDPPPLRLE